VSCWQGLKRQSSDWGWGQEWAGTTCAVLRESACSWRPHWLFKLHSNTNTGSGLLPFSRLTCSHSSMPLRLILNQERQVNEEKIIVYSLFWNKIMCADQIMTKSLGLRPHREICNWVQTLVVVVVVEVMILLRLEDDDEMIKQGTQSELNNVKVGQRLDTFEKEDWSQLLNGINLNVCLHLDCGAAWLGVNESEAHASAETRRPAGDDTACGVNGSSAGFSPLVAIRLSTCSNRCTCLCRETSGTRRRLLGWGIGH